ncbi:outer membrane autotransporter barrel domain protein, partial [Burkholderia sp. lig30]|uniref:autotransporter outer membrane beta-barrel domain-containing protein n=1 Tax=Burkholderia sp. lig30 TaxID=1192124 RepID=UPI000461C829
TVSNSGLITGTTTGLSNTGSITLLTNSSGHTISGGTQGVLNTGTIASISNAGAITGGIDNSGSTALIGQLTNTSTGSLDSLTNTGTIGGGAVAIGLSNAGTIGTVSNSGLITGTTTGLSNTGSITQLTNNAGGTISGALYNNGTIGTLTNNGTLASSGYALDNGTSASLGIVANSGTIAGNIRNLSSQDLTLAGGTGSTFGTLTGFLANTPGTITNTASNVSFASGNLLLNDNINVGAFAVNHTGTAVLQVNAPVTITGNYNQGSLATLQIGVSSGAVTQGSIATDSGYGRLIVTGNTSIASGASIKLLSRGYAFATGQRFVVVDTAGSATYNPTSLNYSATGYTGTITGTAMSNGGNSDLVVVLGGHSSPGQTPSPTASPGTQLGATIPNAISSLTGLLAYTGISNANLLNLYNAVLGSLGDGSSNTANHIGKQLGATQTGLAPAAPTVDAMSIVGSRVNTLRIAQNAGETGIATGDSTPQWSVWGEGFGGHASQDERQSVDGYSANYGGLLVGVDRALGERWRAGGAFTYSNTALNNTGDTAGNSARVNGYGLIGYASYTGSPWYVNLSGAAVQQQYDTTRLVSLTGYSANASGHFSGQQYLARVEAGYPLALGPVTLTPLAGVTYSHQHQGSYTETGGNGAALSVGSSDVNSVKSSLGVQLDKGFTSRYGQILSDVRVQWIHEYDQAKQVTAAGFAADPTGQTAFTTVGARPVSDLADVSLGVTLLRASNLSVSVRYELQAASGFLSQTGSVRLRQVF